MARDPGYRHDKTCEFTDSVLFHACHCACRAEERELRNALAWAVHWIEEPEWFPNGGDRHLWQEHRRRAQTMADQTDGQGRNVAAALNGDPSITDDEHAANARLIAAAPELAHELRALVQWVEAETDGRDWPHERLNAARALLARIDGKE